jgi:hypothetical protein
MKLLAALLLTITLSGCSPFGIVGSMLTDDAPSLDVDTQIGKTNEKVTGVKAEEFSLVKKETTADTVVEDAKIGTISATGDVSIDEQVPAWIWLLAILGWLLPSPSEIWKGLGNLAYSIKRFIKE